MHGAAVASSISYCCTAGFIAAFFLRATAVRPSELVPTTADVRRLASILVRRIGRP